MNPVPVAEKSPSAMNSLTVSAQHLEPGQGGIGRVSRLSVKALQRHGKLRALAVEDRRRYSIDSVQTVPCGGSRLGFFLANSWEVLSGRKILYDFAGTARAHLPVYKYRSSYAVWIHGLELWNRPVRSDYVSAVRGADLILANSHYTLARAEETIGGLPQAQVCWLGTEQDEAVATPPQSRAPALLFLGRSDDLFAKGQDILIDAWPDVISKVPGAKLIFAGGGTHLPKLVEMTRASPAAADIEILGFLSDAEIDAVWARATAFAMLSHVEGFGLVYAEAMRQGVPVLASTEDASQEINLDGVTGFNVSRSDRSGIIDRIVCLMRDRELASALGSAGLERWRKNFRFSCFQERFDRLIHPWIAAARG
jgi:phosphatidyl-myo-inositol dimannoside synthase